MKYNSRGKPLFAEGGEGFIYELNQKSLAKIYKDNVDIATKKKKVEALIQAKLPKEVVKPTDILTNNQGKFIGYAMPRVTGDDFKRLSNKKFVINKGITTKDILQMLSAVWRVIQEVHKLNIIIGDLNDQNILFDVSTKNVFFIDVDSWSIAGIPCTVAMDTFKDPQLKGSNFNEGTDTYAFCVLAFKSLTRLHPYGGTMNPDINIIERMQKGISVIDNPNVKLPKMCKSWRNLSPDLIADFKNVFDNGSRQFGNLIKDNFEHMTLCSKDNDYYYSAFQSCPFCNANVRIIKRAVAIGVENGFKIAKMLNENVKMVFSQYIYLTANNEIVDIRSGSRIPYNGTRVLFDSHGNAIYRHKDKLVVSFPETITSINVLYNTYPVVDGEFIYYVDSNKDFCKFKIIGNGLIGNTVICQCSYENYYNACDGHYCLINVYNGKIITNIDGYYSTFDFDKKISNCDARYDRRTNRWLIIIEDTSQCYHSFVIEKNTIIWQSDKLNYKCPPQNVCFDNSAIYIPIDDAIRGFNYKTMNFKDFKCSVVSSDSQLVKSGNQFLIVNDDNIYRFYK